MSAEKLLNDVQGHGVRFEPCAPFNSGVDVDQQIPMSWSSTELRLSHAHLMSTVTGHTFRHLHAIKNAITAHVFGDGFVLCVPKFKDREIQSCSCMFSNYGFLERGHVNLSLMPKNLVKPKTWEIDVLDFLVSHSRSVIKGKLIGERWGIFLDRKDDILALNYFTTLDRTIRNSPLSDSIAVYLKDTLGQLLSGSLQIVTRDDIDYDLNTLVKAILAAKLLATGPVTSVDLTISVVSMSLLQKDSRSKIYAAAVACKSNVVDAIPRRDTCKLATLPNSIMGTGEINATDRQLEMLDIVAAPYNVLVGLIGRAVLEQKYKALKPIMVKYFERFCTGAYESMSGAIVCENMDKHDFQEFCAWWAGEVRKRVSGSSMGTVQVRIGSRWEAADVIDCFALGVLAGSARLAEYLPIEVSLAVMLGLETKLLNPVMEPCVRYDKDTQGAEYRVDSHQAGLHEIEGEAIVRPSELKRAETYQALQNEIRKRTKNVSEDYVLVKWRRPMSIGIVLLGAIILLIGQLIFDRIPDDNIFSIGTRAVTNFVAISVVLITLIVRIFYNDWSLHDMWKGQRQITDVSKMATELKRDYVDIVLALRNSNLWNRALSDTNACLILREVKKKGGVAMKRGVSLQELFQRGYLRSHSSSTAVIPRSDGSLEIFQRDKGGVYVFGSYAKGAVITCYGSAGDMAATVG